MTMIESLLTSTTVVEMTPFSGCDLGQAIAYCTGQAEPRVGVVTDPQPLARRDRAIAELGRRCGNLLTMDIVRPNPTVPDIMAMVSQAGQTGLDAVVGIGGGSTMDSAKALACVLGSGGDLDEYLGATPTRRFQARLPKLILVPTTAGTGAEVTRFGVYTARSGRKYTLSHPLLQADAAILAPELTYSMPPALTAATGIDALAHALETLWNRNASAISDAVATEAAVQVLANAGRAYRSAQSTTGTEGRDEMARAACRAGIAFNLTGTAAVHALSFVLSEVWHVPHGVACAFFLADILRLNAEAAPGVRRKLAVVAALLSGNGAGGDRDDGWRLSCQLAEQVERLLRELRLPVAFADLGVSVTEAELLAQFERALEDPKMRNSLVALDASRLQCLLKSKAGAR